MYYLLDPASKVLLAEKGETGMGYQRINVTADNQPVTYLVLNNEFAFLWAPELFENSWAAFTRPEELLGRQVPQGILSLTAASVTLVVNSAGPPVVPSGTYVPPPFATVTGPGDVFYRLSAFAADHCIISPTAFRPSSYAITEHEWSVVPSGLAAVGRYALPSRVSSHYAWKLEPPAGTPFLVGTVIPNFGLCGGGVEAFFPSGFTGGLITPVSPSLPVM